MVYNCLGCDDNFPFGCHPKKAPAEVVTSYDTAGKHERIEEHMPPYPNQIRCILTAEQLQKKFKQMESSGKMLGAMELYLREKA